MKKIKILTVFLFISQIALSQFVQTNGPESGIIRSLAQNGSYIAASTYSNGVYITNDYGNSWFNVGLRLVNNVAFKGNDLYAASSDGVFKTSNNGLSWNAVLPHYSILLHSAGNYILAGTNLNGIFISSNNGSNWTAINTGLPDPFSLNPRGISSLNNNFVLNNSNTVYFTSNNGTNWSNINGNLPSVWINNITAGNNNIYIATGQGVYRTTNNGTNWEQKNNGLTNTNIWAIYFNSNLLYAMTGAGIYSSTNYGDNWSYLAFNNSVGVYCLLKDNSNLYVGTGAGFYKSIDNGISWGVFNSNLRACTVNDISVRNNKIIFAGSVGGGIYSSTNEGNNWLFTSNGFGTRTVNTFHIAGSKVYCGAEWSGLYLSTNEGNNWSRIDNGFTNENVNAVLELNGNIFAGVNNGIYFSSNGGTNWEQRNNGLTSYYIKSIANKGNTIYLGIDGGGVYMSNNNGLNWFPINSGLSDLYIFKVGVKDNYIFAISNQGGVNRTSNNGISWSTKNSGITNPQLYYMDVTKNLISVCTWPGSDSSWIYTSTNNGDNWVIANPSTPEMAPKCIKNEIGYLYSGSAKSGVWKKSLTGIVSTPSSPNLISPANNSTNVSLVPTLNWDSISSAISYNIQISTNNSFTNIVLDTSGIINSHITLLSGLLSSNTGYYWKVRAGNEGGYSNWSGVWNFSTTSTGINKITSTIPSRYVLSQNFPNPFNPATNIRFDIPKASFVKLTIFDISGKELETLVNEQLSLGTYETSWNASKYSSGIYFCRMQAGEFTETKKMTLIK